MKLEITKDNALKAFDNADENSKSVLKNLFPELFKKVKSWQEMTTWEHICEAVNIHPINDLPYPNPINDKQEGQNAFFVCTTVREVLNEGKDADWSNSSEAKWYPFPDVVKDESKPSGFGLSDAYDFDCANASAGTGVGSRLSFNSREKAKHAFTYFQQSYEKLFLISKTK
jgi:hypothetical protein